MAQTPTYGFPYQTLADSPDGPNLGEDGFLAVEQALKAVDSRVVVLESLKSAPGRIIAYGERTSDKVFSGTEVGVLRLDGVQTVTGWRYIIGTSVLGLAMTTSGDTGQAYLRFRNDGVAAGTTDTLLQQADVNANSAFVPRNSATFAEPYLATATGSLSVLLSLGRSGGAGNITMLGSATRPIRLYVVQGGPDPGNTGVVI